MCIPKKGVYKNIRKCAVCGKEVIAWGIRAKRENIYCSIQCRSIGLKSKNLNVTCPVCGKKFHLKPYIANDGNTHCCSRECCNKHRSQRFSGKGNHQWGLKGKLNASWKSDEKITVHGYKRVRRLEHPFKDCDGFVLEHRLIAERQIATHDQCIEINGKKYLNPSLVVHHKNGNKQDNRPENLQILTLPEHTHLHKSKNTNNS